MEFYGESQAGRGQSDFTTFKTASLSKDDDNSALYALILIPIAALVICFVFLKVRGSS